MGSYDTDKRARDAAELRIAFLLDCLAFVGELADCAHVAPELVRPDLSRCLDCGAIRIAGDGGWEPSALGQRARELVAITRSDGPIARALAGE